MPEPEAAEVVVDVRAAALNHADLDELAGDYVSAQRKTGRPHVVGSDLAGVVATVGNSVSGVRPGDRVMAMVDGAFADFVAFDHRSALPVPDCTDWAEAAALPSALMTEYDALICQGRLAPGQRVLITAATSGVGLVAVDIARWAGAARVLATTTSAQKELLLTTRGAQAVNTRTDDLVATVLAATDGQGVDPRSRRRCAARPVRRRDPSRRHCRAGRPGWRAHLDPRPGSARLSPRSSRRHHLPHPWG